MINFILPLFGRFHPVLVHLPIGFLVFGVILIFLFGKKYETYSQIIQLAFLLGGISALLASLSGFLHYQNEGYTWDTVKFHLILGILTTLLSCGLWYHLKKAVLTPVHLRIKGAVLLTIIMLTGHLGGNITHGEGYFTEVLPPELQSLLGVEFSNTEPLELPYENWEEIEFYTGAIQPILDQNCISCHNPKKLKGELDLSSFKAIQKGGEEGKILVAKNFEESALFTRLVLPEDHEDHMPPKDKRQPRKEEIALIKAWIETGASDKAKLGESKITERLIEPFFKKNEKPFYPTVEISMLPLDSIAKLRDHGFFAEVIKEGSPFLSISCVNFPEFSDSDWYLLQAAKDQIVYLDFTETEITDAIVEKIAMLPNLTVLKLSKTAVSGAGFEKLVSNKNLKLLYINDTKVGFEKLGALDGHPTLEKIFAFNTSAADSGNYSQFSFHLETGNLNLPPLATDTIVY
ncbi:putative membrane protein [Algoriphagus ratkowskyi]|uniref:Putative membrane protein n=1 Tax=Algoriphagus ratkowskyi TaxID=57028 RepID=A0A2W7SE29_9BACT|nr:c-type cytochrome domain-containing protein [Algoriphagus ratkowskyi]PZX61095.1 putative membrane protein [Algoriphagus ratkowskyi]TXD79227.1 hypothetical protein ESW18_03040 [Algoriphagus ratkowskyi]